MKRLSYIIALFITCSAFGQQGNRTTTLLDSFLSVDQASVNSAYDFESFLNKLEKKHSTIKKDENFVQYLFTKTHQLYLKKYEEYAPISSLFKNGSYNCLTGTALYALLLNHFQIPHQIIETNYHIFILAETKQGQILLEATDPVHGFVDSPKEIERRVNSYKKNMTHLSNSKLRYYQFNFELFSPVSIHELHGLLYYNKAVDAYNHCNFEEAIQCLKKAHALYSSSRIEEFSQLLLLTLQHCDMENQLRIEYIKMVLSIKSDTMPVVALK